MEKLTNLNVENFEQHLSDAPGLVMVYFWAPGDYCDRLTSILEKINENRNDVVIYGMDTWDDKNEKTLTEHEIAIAPTLLMIEGGVERARKIGGIKNEEINNFIEDTLAKVNNDDCQSQR